MSKHIITFDYEFDDIGVYTIAVTDYEPFVPGVYSGRPEDCYPDEGGYGDYVVLDEKGNQVDIDGYIDPKTEAHIQQLIVQHMEEFDDE